MVLGKAPIRSRSARPVGGAPDAARTGRQLNASARRPRPGSGEIESKGQAGSNYCDISLVTSDDGRRVVVMSSIDNLMKGQSGSAMQNLNLMFGRPETEGLL